VLISCALRLPRPGEAPELVVTEEFAKARFSLRSLGNEETTVSDLATGEGQDLATGEGQAGRRSHRRLEIVTNWVTALTAVAALVLSVVTSTQVNAQPEVAVSIPSVLRLAYVQPSNAWIPIIWMQPAITINNQSQLSVVVDTTYLELQPESASDSDSIARFIWWETDQYDPEQMTWASDFRFASHPAPFVVSREEPKTPLLHLRAAQSDRLSAGISEGVFHVRLADGRDVTGHFCLDLSETALSDLRKYNNILVRVGQSGVGEPRCYTHWVW
jgi:hypothetical protein